jgi:serpin B
MDSLRSIKWLVPISLLYLVFPSSGFATTTPVEDPSFRMFRALLKSNPTQNLIFSPYSVRQALNLAALGAKGKTFKQLSFGKPPELLPPKKDFGYKFIFANRIWVQNGFPLLDSYQNASDKVFGVRPWVLDFSKAPDFLKDRMNGWVEEKTLGKVKDFIADILTDPSIRIFLGSATYFKADWALPFDPSKTSEGDFEIGAQEKAKVPFVHATASLNYRKLPGMQVLEIPYSDSDLSLFLFLPNPEKSLEEIETSMHSQTVDQWLGGLARREVRVSLPKFTVDTTVSLKEAMSSLGVKDAFNPESADFTGMTGKKNLSLSRFEHRAFISLTEAGTEAGEVSFDAPPASRSPASTPVAFDVTRSFLFGIRHKGANVFLLLGRIQKPKFVAAISEKKDE